MDRDEVRSDPPPRDRGDEGEHVQPKTRSRETGGADMVDFLVETKDIDRETAVLLCSVAMDLVVTQVVDGTKGVDTLISKDISEN